LSPLLVANNRKARSNVSGLLFARSGPERRSLEWVGAFGVLQCGHEIFLALACELFLRGFEARDAACDFFPLQSGDVLLFGHAIPFSVVL
jgi:hypothetical protein